jgi:hypothetical protein
VSYPRELTAALLNVDGTSNAADMGTAFGIDFYDELNGVGRGSLSIPLSEAAAAQITPGRYINILVQTTVRFTFKIEGNPTYSAIQAGEELEQILTVQGRGWAVSFDEAPTYPEVALNARLNSPWRLFSFASPSFPNAGGWAAAVELYEWYDAVSAGRGRYQIASDGDPYPSPISFPVPSSPVINDNSWTVGQPNPPVPGPDYVPVYWLWSEADYPNEEYELGWCFFRNTFVLASDTIITFAASADNYFTFFLQGVPMIGEDADLWMWQGWKEISVPLVAGTWTVGAVVENVGFPGQTGTLITNPGGFIATAHETDGQSLPNVVHLVTDDSWDCFFTADDEKWPGWTPGQIIDQLLDEAVARGELTILSSVTFAATTDSDTLAWLPRDTTVNYAYAASFAVEIGSTLLDALGTLHSQGWIEWHIQPGTFVLDVWRGRLPTPSSSATLDGTNLMSLERAETAVYANALLVQWEHGYVEVEDTAAQTSYGTRVTGFFSSDATSSDDATQAGETELLRRSQDGFPAIVVTVEPTATNDCPYEGFTLGDWVTIPAVGGGTELVRVLSIACSQDGEGNAVWTLELNEKLQVAEAQEQELLRQIGGRLQVIQGTVS